MATTHLPRPGRALAAVAVLLVALGAALVAQGDWTPRLGLDLRGGTSITLTAQTADGGDPSAESLQEAVGIIRDRVNAQGVAEAEVTTQGASTIVVQVPGVGQDEVVELVGQTAELRFRPVLAVLAGGAPAPPEPTATPTPEATAGSPAPTATPTPAGRAASAGLLGGAAAPATASATPDPAAGAPTAPAPTSPAPTAATEPPAEPPAEPTAEPTAEQLAALEALDCAALPAGAADDPEQPLLTCDREGTARFLLAPADLVGTDIADASAGIPTNGISWVVSLDFTGEGADAFLASTSALAAQQFPRNAFAIVLDSRVVSYPTVEDPIPGGQATIEGQFTQAQAQALANTLRYGALPLSFATSEVSTVSPTLGSDQLEAGLVSLGLGLVLVALYSLLYYRALGLVVTASLVVAGALTYSLVVLLGAWIGFTLTLAGVVGIIVSVGITADSFVVFFERIRDEVREGRSTRAAVETGWVRARRTIVVSDVVSLLAAGCLYLFSVSSVRGFAFTLGLITLVDLLVVFLFTKPLLSLVARTRFFASGHPLSGLDPQRLGRPARPAGPTRRGSAAPLPAEEA